MVLQGTSSGVLWGGTEDESKKYVGGGEGGVGMNGSKSSKFFPKKRSH